MKHERLLCYAKTFSSGHAPEITADGLKQVKKEPEYFLQEYLRQMGGSTTVVSVSFMSEAPYRSGSFETVRTYLITRYV